MKFESNRPRLNISNACQQQCGKDLAIGQAALDSRADFFEQTFPWGVFQQTHQWFDLGTKAHDTWIEASFRRRDTRQPRKKSEIAETERGRCGRGSSQKSPACCWTHRKLG